MRVGLTDLYRAYRKAKHEAFFDGTQPSRMPFVHYEAKLERNLRRLQTKLSRSRSQWCGDARIVSGHTYLPKSIQPQAGRDRPHFSTEDRAADWAREFSGVWADIDFRLVIAPTVDFQIISALWVSTVGRVLDAALDDRAAYGNRPRRRTTGAIGQIRTDDDTPFLFEPYFSGYRKWRENGLQAMAVALEDDKRVAAITMDAKRYYHEISPDFLIDPRFLTALDLALTQDQLEFTRQLISAIAGWNASAGLADGRSVPVGLSASKIIANVLLAEFDRDVLRKLPCLYYGRYVDDVFLVLQLDRSFQDGAELVEWLVHKLGSAASLDRRSPNPGMRIKYPYFEGSKVLFAGPKQRIFLLNGRGGLDLVDQVCDQVRQASSEYRLLPELSEVADVLNGALSPNQSPGQRPDTLRKAEGLSVRRHGLSIAVRNLDAYAAEVHPAAWIKQRNEIYGIFLRHVVTPEGVFDYWRYIGRVFEIMVSCGDWSAAEEFLKRFRDVFQIVCAAVDRERYAVELTLSGDMLRRMLLEAAISASTVHGFRFSHRFRQIVQSLDLLGEVAGPRTLAAGALKKFSKQMLLTDLGRLPYKTYWYNENPVAPRQPPLPAVRFIRQMVAAFQMFRPDLKRPLREPYWPGFAFAVRPLSIPEISLMLPGVLRRPRGLARALVALRGALTPADRRSLPLSSRDGDQALCVAPARPQAGAVRIAIPSVACEDGHWDAGVRGVPELTFERYTRFVRLINSILSEKPWPQYVALPECSVPFPWAFTFAKYLARNGVSFICGIEPHVRSREYRNDALVSLVTNFGGYQSHVLFRQAKLDLSHRERREVSKRGLSFSAAPNDPGRRPVYIHSDFAFSVLLCSDFTNLSNRRSLQGHVDALFVLEWNPDVETFSFLVEAASHDLHAAIVQVNSRIYGDSRLRVPFKEGYARDVVRVKGGEQDYFVRATFNYEALRTFQRSALVYTKAAKKTSEVYKPVPIGYEMSSFRKKVV